MGSKGSSGFQGGVILAQICCNKECLIFVAQPPLDILVAIREAKENLRAKAKTSQAREIRPQPQPAPVRNISFASLSRTRTWADARWERIAPTSTTRRSGKSITDPTPRFPKRSRSQRRKLRPGAKVGREVKSPEQLMSRGQGTTSGQTVHCGPRIRGPCKSFALGNLANRMLLGVR